MPAHPWSDNALRSNEIAFRHRGPRGELSALRHSGLQAPTQLRGRTPVGGQAKREPPKGLPSAVARRAERLQLQAIWPSVAVPEPTVTVHCFGLVVMLLLVTVEVNELAVPLCDAVLPVDGANSVVGTVPV